jgi:hypothetical protein
MGVPPAGISNVKVPRERTEKPMDKTFFHSKMIKQMF